MGLGNPGRQYEGTRHNVGFMVLAILARRHGTSRPRQQFQAEVVEANLSGERALLVAPQTFMNRSGQSVRAVCDFYKLGGARPSEGAAPDWSELLVVADDFNLGLGRLRLRAQGSAGGQKGLSDIIRALGSDAFGRLRIGIGTPPPAWDRADYVLGRFSAAEKTEIELACERAADAVTVWAREGMPTAMNRFNTAGANEE